MDQPTNECNAEFDKAMPEKPWTASTPVTKFEPLINLIEQHTQSDLFRRIGKYESNEDYYDYAKSLEDKNVAAAAKTFANGVTIELEQEDGWPTKIVLEDKAAHLKETVTLHQGAHTLSSDKVEFCTVARSREFSIYGESYRAYSFDGGTIEKTSSAPPVLKT